MIGDELISNAIEGRKTPDGRIAGWVIRVGEDPAGSTMVVKKTNRKFFEPEFEEASLALVMGDEEWDKIAKMVQKYLQCLHDICKGEVTDLRYGAFEGVGKSEEMKCKFIISEMFPSLGALQEEMEKKFPLRKHYLVGSFFYDPNIPWNGEEQTVFMMHLEIFACSAPRFPLGPRNVVVVGATFLSQLQEVSA